MLFVVAMAISNSNQPSVKLRAQIVGFHIVSGPDMQRPENGKLPIFVADEQFGISEAEKE